MCFGPVETGSASSPFISLVSKWMRLDGTFMFLISNQQNCLVIKQGFWLFCVTEEFSLEKWGENERQCGRYSRRDKKKLLEKAMSFLTKTGLSGSCFFSWRSWKFVPVCHWVTLSLFLLPSPCSFDLPLRCQCVFMYTADMPLNYFTVFLLLLPVSIENSALCIHFSHLPHRYFGATRVSGRYPGLSCTSQTYL